MRVSGGDLCIRKYAEAPAEPVGETFRARPSTVGFLQKPNGETQPVGADAFIRPSTVGFLQKPNGETQPVGAIHESPENGWIFHKPNGELQSVGVADLGDPRNGQCPFPTHKFNLVCANFTERHRGRSLHL